MEKREGIDRVWTIPNALTFVRLILVGVMAWLFLHDQPIGSMAVYLLAAGTDLLDGYIARHFNQISNIGKVMDPIVDKLMTVTALICMLLKTYLTFGVLLVIIIKETMMIVGGILIFLVFKKVVYSNLYGKISAAAYFFAIMLLYLHNYVAPYDSYFMYLAVAMNIVSMFQYGYINIVLEARKRKKEEAKA
jgi:cardiolipin synthase